MYLKYWFILLLAVVAASCTTSEQATPPAGLLIELNPPKGLPAVPVPADNALTAAAVALGRKLFFDSRLSSDNSLACAGCHRPEQYFTDGLKVARGINGQFGTRNTPTVLNAAYNFAQFWDGRAVSLEKQAGEPIANPKEMNLPHEICLARLNADATYRQEFAAVFGAGAVTMEKVVKAIASFERTLLSGNSAFDRYQYAGEKNALSAAAIRGLAVFTDKTRGNCATCHVIGETSALFTDGRFHNLGTGMNSEGELTDLGRFNQTGNQADRGAFRTPSLRNVARTAPYFHDGSLSTLREVVDFYVGGGNSNPHLDQEIRPFRLSAQERADLLAFLESLTGELPASKE